MYIDDVLRCISMRIAAESRKTMFLFPTRPAETKLSFIEESNLNLPSLPKSNIA